MMMTLTPMSAPGAGRWSWGGVIGLLALATLLCAALEPQVSLTSQAMLYVLAVVLAAYRLDWLPSVVCAVGAVTALNFFFVPPRWTFAVENREHLIALGVMLAVALVISRLAGGLRRETTLAQLNEARARQLQALATELAAAQTSSDVGLLGSAALQTAYASPCNLLLVSPDPSSRWINGAASRAVLDGLQACMKERAVLGPGTGRWPGLQAWYLPLMEQEQVLGAACVQPAVARDEAGREHARALCALLAQAQARLVMERSAQAAQREVEHQQMQNTFLAAISHDLRTPLAAIVAAVTSLQTQGERIDSATRARLLAGVLGEAEYLVALSDNTLQLLRLSTPGQGVQRQWESLEEIVGAVLARLRPHDADHRLHASPPERLPLVRADAMLLAQLLSNLLDNALKYSEGEVEVQMGVHGEHVELCVLDHGAGVPEAERESVFLPYVRGDRAGRRGMGLGLAVCRAIAQAHGGQLVLRARAGGGSCFCLQLPLEPQPASPEALS